MLLLNASPTASARSSTRSEERPASAAHREIAWRAGRSWAGSAGKWHENRVDPVDIVMPFSAPFVAFNSGEHVDVAAWRSSTRPAPPRNSARKGVRAPTPGIGGARPEAATAGQK